MTKVKICGITNLEDALLSAKFGADALGFNFYKKSPRFIAPEKAAEIIGKLPENVLKVGVFVNENLEKIAEIAAIAGLGAIQLHGEETPEFVQDLKENTNLEIIKAFRVSKDFAPEDVLKYRGADAILLDAYSPKEHGGTGETFDWEIAKKVQEIFPKMYLAGGLSQDNLGKAIIFTKPFAIDICSSIESNKGKKERVKTINLLSEFKYINQQLYQENDLLNILRGFRSNPGLNFYGKSITNLCVFIFGYLSALDKKESEKQNKFLKEFEKFEGIKRGGFINGIYLYYIPHFLEKVGNDESKAFDLFFSRLEEFKLENENSTNK